MGMLRDLLIKNPDKKFWVQVALDVIILVYFLYLGLSLGNEFNRGYEACAVNSCVLCMINTINSSYALNESENYSFPFK